MAKSLMKRAAAFTAAAVLATSSAQAQATSAGAEYSFRIIDMPLETVLDVLGRDMDVEFMIDGSARTRVRDIEVYGTRDDIVRALMRSAGMDAFTFNGQVHVSPSEEREVRLVRLGEVTSEAAIAALDQAGLVVPDFSISEVASGGALVLSGPIKYLAISESVIASLRAEPELAQSPVRVRRAGRLDTEGSSDASVSAAAE
jgi:type II secretory pathway component GspD/PulD (secretin)